MRSTDCFYSKETGDLTAFTYGSVNSSVSTIAVPLFYRSLGVSGPLRTASPLLTFIPTLNQRLERGASRRTAKKSRLKSPD
ncbi:MAG: hypothetical protein AAF703_23130 [Cyanobacteria bacterium P01_D01_bin.105]